MMTPKCQSFLLAMLAVLITGCATGPREALQINYNEQQNRTVYQARRITTNYGNPSGYGSQRRIQIRAHATCEGQQCSPSEIELLFFTEGGDEIYIPDRSVIFQAGGERYEWLKNRSGRDVTETGRVVGKIVGIVMTPEQLTQIARAESVKCTLGSQTFSLGYGEREPLRKLAQKVAGT